MAIPSKQIGWSNESNLLWQISKQLEQLIAVTSKLTTTTTTTTVAPTTTTTTTATPTTTTTTTPAP
jgi:hypothetical protein